MYVPYLKTAVAILPYVLSTLGSDSFRFLQKRQWDGPPNCDSRLGGLDSSDCLNAISDMSQGGLEANHEEHTFYTQSSTYPSILNPATIYDSVDITQAKTWKSGECTVALRMPDPTKTDYAIYQDLISSATRVHNACVFPSMMGGRITVGDRQNMELLIYQESEDDSDTEDTDPSQGQCPLEAAEKHEDVRNCFLGGISIGSGGGK